MLVLVLKGTVSRDSLLLFFFHESVSPKPLIIPLGPFQIFSKIRGDIRSYEIIFNHFFWTPLGSRVAAGVVDTGGKLPSASLKPVVNLPPVSLTPVANLPPLSTTIVKLLEKFAAGVVDTGGTH